MNLSFKRNVFLLLALPHFIHAGKVMFHQKGGIQNEWIVIMKEDTTTAANRRLRKNMFDSQKAQLIANEVGNSVGESVEVKKTFSKSMSGFSAKMSTKAAELLAQRKDVDFVEQNSVVTVDQSVEWGIDRVDQRNLPLDNTYTSDGDGSGVFAYIIDTGVLTTHDEFGGRATWGYNSIDNNDVDCNGHGTHVAGTVGGATYGVAKNVNIVAVKVLDCGGTGTTAGVIEGVEWVEDDAAGKLATANLSLGGGSSSALNLAVKNLHESGVPTVAAAGNNSADACNYSPAGEETIITVGATDDDDSRSSFSNYGNCIDIFAPGRAIESAFINDDSDTTHLSGTSMAAPHVCGAAALLLSVGITASDVANEIISRATTDTVTNRNSSANRLLYVGAIGSTPAPTTAPPTPAPTFLDCGNQALFSLELLTDHYPLETSWVLQNSCTGQNQLSVSAGTYTNAEELYAESRCVPHGEYTFTISDTFGDGICCGYGSGSYRVLYEGTEVGSGAIFGGSETSGPFGSCPQWESVYENDFENGQGEFEGTALISDNFSNSGSKSLTFVFDRDLKTDWLSLQTANGNYSKLRVSFWFLTKSFESGDKFKLQVKFDGDNNWTLLDSWMKGTEFTNNKVWYEEEIEFDVPAGKNDFRFRYRYTNTNNFIGHIAGAEDSIYIDDFLVEGST